MIKHFQNFLERFKSRYRAEWVEDLPDAPCARTVYVVGGREHPFYAAVVCPRKGCNEIAHLEIAKQLRRKWILSEHADGTVSLYPSVHVTGLKCRCHYWLRRGQIVWSESPPLFVPKENKTRAD